MPVCENPSLCRPLKFMRLQRTTNLSSMVQVVKQPVKATQTADSSGSSSKSSAAANRASIYSQVMAHLRRGSYRTPQVKEGSKKKGEHLSLPRQTQAVSSAPIGVGADVIEAARLPSSKGICSSKQPHPCQYLKVLTDHSKDSKLQHTSQISQN